MLKAMIKKRNEKLQKLNVYKWKIGLLNLESYFFIQKTFLLKKIEVFFQQFDLFLEIIDGLHNLLIFVSKIIYGNLFNLWEFFYFMI